MAIKRYRVETVSGISTEDMCAELLGRPGRPDGNETVVRLVFFDNTADNARYSAQLETINAAVSRKFGEMRPAVTYIAQEPMQGRLMMEVTTVDRNADGGIDIKYRPDSNYLVITDRTGRELIAGGILSGAPGLSVAAQSEAVFGRLRKIMDAEGFPVDSIVRQWNYIEGITKMDGMRQRYQDFNDARSRFYASASWAEGYPAATGIGVRTGGVIVEVTAFVKEEGIVDVPLDNPLQVAAHSYSQHVLMGAVDRELLHRTTPKFERARLIGCSDRAAVYVSGTAAIRGEESHTENDDVTEQTRVTMENIERLCSPENIKSYGVTATGARCKFDMLRIYIKNPDYYYKVKGYMDSHYGDVPKFYLMADVCRRELLVEIEGVAQCRLSTLNGSI